MSELPNVRIPALILSVALSDQDVRSITEYTDAVIRNTMKRLAAQLRDGERYRHLRDNPWPSQVFEVVIHQKNAVFDQTIDAWMKSDE